MLSTSSMQMKFKDKYDSDKPRFHMPKKPLQEHSIEELIDVINEQKKLGISLPKILFGEMHLDPATDRILMKIAPILKQIGYDVFFEEIPEDKSDSEKKSEDDKIFSSKMKELEIIIYKNKKYGSEDQEKKRDKKEDYQETMKDKNGESCEAYRNMVNTLKLCNIQYQFVDKECVFSDEIDERDVHMAKRYHEEERPVFGRVGLAHISGMQKEFKKRNARSDGKEGQYLCFNVHSTAITSAHEGLIRSGCIRAEDFPFGLHCIDAMSMTENQIIKMILIKMIESMIQIEKSHKLTECSDEKYSKFMNYLLSAKKKGEAFSHVDKLQYGRSVEEEVRINKNLLRALEKKLITNAEINKLAYKHATIKYVFNNDFGLLGLRLKLFKLKDMDGVSPSVMQCLMSKAGLCLMAKGFKPIIADKLDYSVLQEELKNVLKTKDLDSDAIFAFLINTKTSPSTAGVDVIKYYLKSKTIYDKQIENRNILLTGSIHSLSSNHAVTDRIKRNVLN